MNDKYEDGFSCKIWAPDSFKMINIQDISIRVRIYNHITSERFRPNPHVLYKKSEGFFIVCDITNRSSIEHAKSYYDNIKIYANDDVKILLLLNKCDKNENREINNEEIKKIANELGINYFETSAKTGQNVHDVFYLLIEDIIKNNEIFNNLKIKLEKDDKKVKNNKCNK